MISIEYDPGAAGTEFELFQRVISVGKFVCKSAVEKHVALREAELRLKELERRVPRTTDAEILIRQIILGVLYSGMPS